MTVVLVAAAVWLAISIPVAIALGRAIRVADHPPIPPAARSGEEARRRGHLHAV